MILSEEKCTVNILIHKFCLEDFNIDIKCLTIFNVIKRTHFLSPLLPLYCRSIYVFYKIYFLINLIFGTVFLK